MNTDYQEKYLRSGIRGVLKMQSVENAECENEECGKCWVWKMTSVESAECRNCVENFNFPFQFPCPC